MPDNDDRRKPALGDDTFDELFPADGGSRARQAAPEPHAAATEGSGLGYVGSPPPPRRAGLVLPWVIIAASVLAIAVVGFMLLRGQRTKPNTAAGQPVTTVSASTDPSQSTSSGSSSSTPSSSSSSSSSASVPPPATAPPPGFVQCTGTDTGYKVTGSGTTCPFVADVATKAAQQAGNATGDAFQLTVVSAATKKSYDVRCKVAAYLECSLPGANGSTPTYIYVMRK